MNLTTTEKAYFRKVHRFSDPHGFEPIDEKVFADLSWMSVVFRRFCFTVFSISAGAMMLGCSQGGADFSSLEGSVGAANIPCTIAERSPLEASVKISSVGASRIFNVTTATSTCRTYYFINGVRFNSESANFIEVSPALFTAGANTVRVESSNDLGSDFREWTVVKNAPPTCGRTAPTASALNMSSSSSQSFTAAGSGEPGETLTFNWKLDGVANPGLVETISGVSASQAILTASSTLIGTRVVTASVSDGLDSTLCTWTVNVGQDCATLSKSPNVASLRIAAAAGSSNGFSISTTADSCLVAWKLNGVGLTGTSNNRTVGSSELNLGTNILAAEVTSTSGVTAQSWLIIKNSPPSCSQSPNAAGNFMAVGSILDLTANVTDANGDPLTWSWKQNGVAVSNPPVAILNNSSSTTASFTPTSSHVGFNSFQLRMDDGFDSSSCDWTVQVQPRCQITSSGPVGASVTIPNLGTNMNGFSVVPSDGGCAVSWNLNGINLGTNSAIINLLSSTFATNTVLTATVSNSASTDSRTWTVTKNSPPVCSSVSPPNSGVSSAVGTARTFTANFSDANSGQTLTYDWKLNGNIPSGAYFSKADSIFSSAGTWTPLTAQAGSNTLSVQASDGFDPVTCSWPVEVLKNCSVSSSSPAGSNFRVSFAPSTSTSFGVVPNDASCAIVWKLNGTTISNDVNFQTVLSSSLSAVGPNTVTATLTNAVGSAVRSWAVTKNSKPVCASQSPAAAGNSVNVGGTQVFTGSATDFDSDPLTFAWDFAGANAGLFSGIANSTLASTANFSAGLGQVGNNQNVTLTMNDGYDTAVCSWSLNVIDPNSAQILSWTPTASPVVILSNGSQAFSVSAAGTGLMYSWYLDGVMQTGRSTAATEFFNSDMTIGLHEVKIIVTDAYGKNAEKSFSVKRNAAPTVSSFLPNVSGVSNFKVNFNSSLNFSVGVTDANSDSLTYAWTIDGAASSILNSGSDASQAALIPAGNLLLLGPHTVRVSVSDGFETVVKSWSVLVNMFSVECNELYNSSSTGANGGRVCTLIGNPSMGHGQNILTDQTLLKARPYAIIELETDVYAFTDHLNNAVVVYNANGSGPIKNYFGQSIAAGTAKVVVGNGAAGRNNDASAAAPVFQTIGSVPNQVSVPVFKLNEPRGLAFDSSRSILYIADRLNNRVMALNSSGQIYRVLGLSGGANTQNSTTNSLTESFGYNQVCIEPIGLAISGRYLYVGCWAQSVIKRVNIDDPSAASAYTLAKTVVGRQNGTSTNLVSPISAVSPDGLADANNTPASGGVAYANGVIDVAADGAGLIYWLERLGGGQGLRIRAYNAGNTSVSFYGSSPNSDHVSLSGVLNIQGFDLTGSALTSTATQANIVSATVGTLAAVGSQAATSLGQNVCHLMNVRLLDGSGNTITTASSNVVTMSVTAGVGFFYSDSSCSTLLPLNQFTIPAGATQGSVYVKMTGIIATYGLRAATGVFNVTASGSVVAPLATATTIRVTAPPRFRPDECIAVEIGLANGSSPAILAAGRVVAPATNNYGSFYSNSACSSQIDRVTFTSATATQIVFFKRTVTIPPGWTGSLIGYNGSAAASYSQYSDVKIGQMRFEDGQAGLDILKNAGTGLPDGIFYSNQNQHYLSFINFKTVDPGFAVPIASQASTIVFGLGNLATPTDITGGYNGEDQPAWGTRLNQPVGVRLNLAQTKVLFGDYLNYRGRSYEIDVGGYARSPIGAGRSRDRLGVTVSDPTQTALVSPYKLEITNGYLYFSEYGNNRIRRTNLSSGSTDVVAGNGTAGTPTEGNDAIADNMTNPRGFKVVPYPTTAAPTNYVLIYAETCQIRAVNLSGPTISGFFGVGNLLPGKVKTIAGDTSFGCGTWSSLPNYDGMNALTARLNVPEDIAFINGEIFIVNSLDHCLVKITATGTLVRPQGASSCSTTLPTSNDAAMDNMRTRYPKSFAPDVASPGNYFLIDQYSDTTGFIRYLNNSADVVKFKSSAPVLVAGKSSVSSPIPVATIYQFSATSGASGVGGVATWSETTGASGPNDKVCWTAGVLSNGANGAHAIYCANRNQDDDGTLAAGPSNGSGIRGGAPLDREQEKISRLNATFYAPNGIAFDDDGNLYVSEFNNHIIRMIRKWW